MGASASVPGHPQPLNLSQTLPSMTEWSGHALQQLSPPPPVQHAGGRPPFTTPTLESMGALVGACCRCSCWCKSLLGGTPRSQCWVTSLWTAHHPWWCAGYTEPPSRHSLPGIPIQKVPGHRNTGMDNLVVSVSPILVISFPLEPLESQYLKDVSNFKI